MAPSHINSRGKRKDGSEGGGGRLPPLSLRGLDLEDVLRGVMQTPPPSPASIPARKRRKARKPAKRRK